MRPVSICQSAETLRPEEKERYVYPQVRVIGPGGPYLRMPWQRVFKVSVSIQTVNVAFDPDAPEANQKGTVLEAVTKDQLNIGLSGQIRYRVCEQNLYAYLFGVKRPIAHVIGYFVSILRERIANYEAPPPPETDQPLIEKANESLAKAGVSINDLRKNLNHLNVQMDQQCVSSCARYGMILDASLITGIDPPEDIESALAAINTVHNEVSSNISLAQANADQRIEQSRRAVEIETNRAEAEVQPLRWMAQQLTELKQSGDKRYRPTFAISGSTCFRRQDGSFSERRTSSMNFIFAFIGTFVVCWIAVPILLVFLASDQLLHHRDGRQGQSVRVVWARAWSGF